MGRRLPRHYVATCAAVDGSGPWHVQGPGLREPLIFRLYAEAYRVARALDAAHAAGSASLAAMF